MAAVVALKEFRAAARAEGRSLAAALDEAAEATGYSKAQLYRRPFAFASVLCFFSILSLSLSSLS